MADKADEKYASLAKLSLAQIYFADGRDDQGEAMLRDLMAHPTPFVSKEQAPSRWRAISRRRSPPRPESCSIRCAPCRARSARRRSRLTPNCRSSKRRQPSCWRGCGSRWSGAGGAPTPNPTIPIATPSSAIATGSSIPARFAVWRQRPRSSRPELSDHFRNRLTHTIEVAQIARTLAGVLQLDEDLTEALALAHDIGHPPFAHAGEEALNRANASGSATGSTTTCTRCGSSSVSSSGTPVSRA